MAQASIPVDLLNPGQVFACLGFLEAAEVLLGDAEGGFDWRDETDVRFHLRAKGEENPFAGVLEFLATAKPQRWAPIGYSDPPPKKGQSAEKAENEEDSDYGADPSCAGMLGISEVFYTAKGDRMSLPIRLGGGNRPVVELGHWADGSSRDSFKLYAGNRSADRIAHAMLRGVRCKPKKNQAIGDLKVKGITQLWEEQRDDLIKRPFHLLTPMGGSFNFDPRGAWTAIDAGYSPNEHKHLIEASPVVEFLAAWGLENARPVEFGVRQVGYAVWSASLPPMLARAALAGSLITIPLRQFRFDLDLSGKNKVVTFAREEPRT